MCVCVCAFTCVCVCVRACVLGSWATDSSSLRARVCGSRGYYWADVRCVCVCVCACVYLVIGPSYVCRSVCYTELYAVFCDLFSAACQLGYLIQTVFGGKNVNVYRTVMKRHLTCWWLY